jgi:hypothetical protein
MRRLGGSLALQKAERVRQQSLTYREAHSMSIPAWLCRPICLLVPAALVMAGCWESEPEPRGPTKESRAKGEGKKVNVHQNIWLEMGADMKRRVLVSAEVCLRQGPLEQFLTRKGQKEHEAIFAADIDARKLHETLLLAGATPGSPVRFDPRFRAPTGTTIVVSVLITENGATRKVPARSMIRNSKTGAELECDWVFAGSMLVENPFDPAAPKRYLANDGDIICVANFESALLDVPISSSKGDEEHSYEAWTYRIPPEGTKVVIVFEPQVPAKK